MTDEADLVAAARAGPGGAGFAAIYHRYGDRIHDYCLAVLRHREDAADATQDTFLLAYQRLGQLRDPDRLTPWLYAIARSRCLRRIADRKRQRPTDDLEPLSPPETAPASEVERGELRRLVWEAAAGLAASDRAVLDLHLRHGLSGADLADALGVPAEKANLMLHRVKQRMGRTIGALLVARTGRQDCPDLAAIATGDLTPLIRKRLARHIERCRVCLERRNRLAPELAYAAVPLVPAPLALQQRILELTASDSAGPGAGPAAGPAAAPAAGTADGTVDGTRWDAAGFPPAGDLAVPLPLPQRIAIGAGIAALVGLGLLGGFAAGRTIAAGDPPPRDAPAVVSASPTVRPGSTPSPDPPSPAAQVPPAPGGTPGTSATAPGTPSASSAAPPDVTAPTLSSLRLGDCGVTVTAEIDVTDTVDPEPTADLMLSWNPGPGSPVPMQHAGGGTYRATVDRQGAALGFVTFTASGTVADASGNEALRQASESCSPVVD